MCRPLLLLHNIQSVLNQNKELKENARYKSHIIVRFPFHLFKREANKGKRFGWEIEHISSNSGDSDEIEDLLLFLYSASESLDNIEKMANEICPALTFASDGSLMYSAVEDEKHLKQIGRAHV